MELNSQIWRVYAGSPPRGEDCPEPLSLLVQHAGVLLELLEDPATAESVSEHILHGYAPYVEEDLSMLGLRRLTGAELRLRLQERLVPQEDLEAVLASMRLVRLLGEHRSDEVVRRLAVLATDYERHPDAWRARRCAAMLLGDAPQGEEAVEQALRKALGDPHRGVRKAAEKSLESRGTPGDSPARRQR